MRTYCIANIDCIHPFYQKMDEYAFACKNIFNKTLYEYRQNFFYQEPLLTAFDMINYLSNKEKEDNVPAKVKQQTIKQVYESFKSSVGKSKLPCYLNKETGRANIILTNQAILKTRFTNENKIAFKYHDFCFEFNITNLTNKLELKFEHIKQVRVIYNSTYKKYKVLLYVEKEKSKKDSLEKEPKLSQVAAVDLGLNNLMALVFQNQRILFDGKPLKKINHRFNKNLAKLQSQLDKAINELKAVSDEIKPMEQDAIWFYELEADIDIDFDVEKYQKLMRRQNDLIKEIDKLKTKIGKLYEKRNNRINYCLHERSKKLIELLASNGIIKIVIGYNKNWKQDINLGKRTNQNFFQIPFYTLIEYIKYKAQETNIEVITHEESYTSKCSFLDDEAICKHDIYAGRRIKRGLFRSKTGIEINADINAAYNIARKAGFNFKQFESLSPCSWAVVKSIQFN